ncbi:hypothetical protein [Mailhella sp.]
MFDETLVRLTLQGSEFGSTVRDDFGRSIMNDVLVPLYTELQYLCLADEAAKETIEHMNMLSEESRKKGDSGW